MGWQDAPLAPDAAPPAAGSPAWMSAPVVGDTSPAPKPQRFTSEEERRINAFALKAKTGKELADFAATLGKDRGITLENADAIVNALHGGARPNSRFDYRPEDAPPQSPSLLDYGKQFVHTLGSDVAGVGEGIAGGVDVATRGLGYLLARGSHALGMPDWVTNDLDNPITIGGTIRSVTPEPKTTVERYSRAASSGLGAVASGQGLGSFLSRAATPVRRGVGELLLSSPGLQALGGTSGALASQGTADAGYGPTAQLLVGLGVGAAVPTAVHAPTSAIDVLLGKAAGRTDQVENAAASYVRGNASKPIDQVMSDLRTYEPSPSGAKSTLAEVTLDPGLAAMQRGVGNISPTAGARIGRRVNDNAHIRMGAIDSTLGDGDPAAIRAAAEARQTELSGASSAAVERVGPLVPPDEAGAAARSTLTTAYQGARGRTADAYGHPLLNEDPPVRLRPFDPEDVTVPSRGDVRPLSAFQEEAVRASRSALPAPPQSMLQFVRSKGGVWSGDNYAGDFRSEGMGSRGQPTLVNSQGRPLDDLREQAVEAGYIPHDTSLADFAQMLAGEYRGTASPRYSDADASGMLHFEEASRARDWWRQQFDTRNLDPARMSNEDWVRFYNEVEGTASHQPRSLDDLRSESGPGSPMGPFQQTIMALRDRYFGDGGAEASAPVRGFLGDVLNADEVGLRTLEGWERRARDLAANAPDRTTAASLRAIAEAIGAKAGIEGGPDRRAALDAARGVRRDQGRTFEEGAVGRVLGRGDYGRFNLPDSEVGRVLAPAGRAGGEVADQLRTAAGGEAEPVVRAEVRRALDQAGSDPRQIAKVAANYQETISRFPELQDAVRGARETAALAARFRATKLGQLVEGGDPASAVARLLTLKDGGSGFRQLVQDEGMNGPALAGVRRAIAEHIGSSSKTAQVDENLRNVPSPRNMSDGLAAVLDRTKGTKVLTVAQRRVLGSVRQELQADQFARSANRPSGSDTARNMTLGMRLVEKAISHAPNPGGLRTVIQYVVRDLSRSDQVMDVVAQAIEDPKFAARLLERPTPSAIARAKGAARAYAIGATEGSMAERK